MAEEPMFLASDPVDDAIHNEIKRKYEEDKRMCLEAEEKRTELEALKNGEMGTMTDKEEVQQYWDDVAAGKIEHHPLYSTYDEKLKVYEMPPDSLQSDIIKGISLALLEKKLAEDGLIETIHSIKTECVLQVESEWDITKDKALSNATKRGVEVDLRLSGDDEYIMRVRQQEALHREIQRDQIELDFQRREFQRQNGNAAISVMLERIADSLEVKPFRSGITMPDGTRLEP